MFAALTLAVLTVGAAEANTGTPRLAEKQVGGPSTASSELPTIPVETLSIGPAASDLPGAALLRGADARRQLIVTARSTDGDEQDFTRRVDYASNPEGIVGISPDGLVTPLADGEVTITATWVPGVVPGEGSSAVPTGGSAASYKAVAGQIKLTVTEFERQTPVNFPNQIVPIFTKYGCNSGGCHGKSSGQNGFRLSLLGFYPDEDYEFLVKESRGRRVSAAAPDQSLLLLKSTNAVPHGGGARLEVDSQEYRLIHRWMRQGLPYGSKDDPRVVGLEVFPSERTMRKRDRQQFAVFAHYSDGSVEDVTLMAQYESNDTEMAEVTPRGTVLALDRPGTAAVMIRFRGQVGVFRASMPLGATIAKLPPVRNFIDELAFENLRTLGIPPSELCGDATFLRRVTVDVAGRLPTADEARAFEASKDPAKRDKLIESLLESTAYSDYFANKWSSILRNRKGNNRHTRGTYAFHDWIRTSLHRNKPYDQFVREIIAASGDVEHHPPVAWYRSVNTRQQQVEDTAQLFLGLRIQCARCHHHPFEVWSQKDYYSFAAFFSRVGKKNGRNGLSSNDEPRIYHRRGTATDKNPRSQEVVRPTGLGGDPMSIPPEDDPRQRLADWLAEPENPFFAPALVNRYWKHFFGRGVVEPEDDMRVTNPASHPALLKALGRHFIDSGFDLKELVRAIVRSSTYQLSSFPNEFNGQDQQNYSRYYPKRLTAEVLYDSLYQVTGNSPSFGGLPKGTRAVQLPDAGIDNYFLRVFGKPKGESSCECERSQDASLAQSLHLLNSKEIHQMLTANAGRAAQLAKKHDKASRENIEEFYYWVYARPPEAEEVKIALAHLESTENKRQGYEDILWALVNTKEFLFNH